MLLNKKNEMKLSTLQKK